MNEQKLGQLLREATPELRPPGNLAATVRQQAIRRRSFAFAATAATAAVLTGAVFLAGMPFLRMSSPGPGPNLPAAENTPQPSPTTTELILRTDGCAGSDRRDYNEINNAIWPSATERYADVFAVTELRPDNVLRVYRKPSAQFDEWILSEFAGDCVEIAAARYSAQEMQPLMNRISGESSYWRARGIELLRVGGNPVDGVITVGVPTGAVDLARQEFPSRYPDLRIEVTQA